MIRLENALLPGVLAMGLAACANDRPPVIEEYTGTFGLSRNAVMSTLSSDAAYRSAYILLGSGATNDRHSGQFCPEPPPDVAQSIAAAVTGSLTGKIAAPAGQTGGEVGVDFGKSIATEISALLKRSQGLQFYRDQAFYTCVAFLNGAIDYDIYKAKLSENAAAATQLIALEIILSKDVSKVDTDTLSVDVDRTVGRLKPILDKLRELQPKVPEA